MGWGLIGGRGWAEVVGGQRWGVGGGEGVGRGGGCLEMGGGWWAGDA